MVFGTAADRREGLFLDEERVLDADADVGVFADRRLHALGERQVLRRAWQRRARSGEYKCPAQS